MIRILVKKYFSSMVNRHIFFTTIKVTPPLVQIIQEFKTARSKQRDGLQ